MLYPLSKLNIHYRKFRFGLREISHYQELLEIEKRLHRKNLTEQERLEMLKHLDEINAHAIQGGVPISEEADYFNFLNAIFLLRVKIQNVQIKD